jgi:hypothetical protein
VYKLNYYKTIGKANEWIKFYLRMGVKTWREKKEENFRVIKHFQAGNL